MEKKEKNISFEYYKKDIKGLEVLPQEEQQELIRKYKKYGDRESYNRIIEHTLPLSVHIARKYENRSNIDYLDLIQVGNLGIIKALESYDSTKGIPFYLYAGRVIENSIRNQMMYGNNIIKSPHRINSIRIKYENFIIDYYKEHGVYPSDKIIKEEIKIKDGTLFKVKTIDKYQPVSINTKIDVGESGDYEEKELQDFIGDEDKEYANFETKIDTNITLLAVKNLLIPRDYYIAYYRLFADKTKTEEELCKELYISRQGVQQIEERYKEKLKRSYEKEKVRILGTYSISQLEKMNLEPLSPGEICMLHSLKEKYDEYSYYFIYTRFVDRYKKVDYYKKFINNTPKEIDENIEFYDDILNSLFTQENLSKELNKYKSKYKMKKIFELDILPNRKIEKSKKIDMKKIK